MKINLEQVKNYCLHHLFEAQVSKNSPGIALTFQGDNLTYNELNIRANKLAYYLQELGVKSEVMVGLYLEPSLETIISILAIIKAGGAYIPLDSNYPQERLNYILKDSKIEILITKSDLNKLDFQEKFIFLDQEQEIIEQKSESNPNSDVTPNNLLYVIYTSGTTGQPKGVMINHYNVVNLFEMVKTYFNFNENDIWTQFHSYSFGFSVWEIWGALLHGGKLVIIPNTITHSPEDFYDLIIQEKVTILSQTPTAFRLLTHVDKSKEKELFSLRYIIFSGESLETYLLKSWFDKYGDSKPELINMYAITETSGEIAYRRLTKTDLIASKSSIIGVPLPGVEFYLLDEQMQPVSDGEIGEIYIGGNAVGRGYLNQPELTAEKFINNIFDKSQQSKLYKTGDLGRYLSTGEIAFCGRIDNQIKIRGYRIELAEIEAKLAEYPLVKEAVIIVSENEDNKQLIAYIIPEKDLTPQDLQKYLKGNLPDYMIPNAFVFLDKLPLSPNGKLDRDSLPLPDENSIVRKSEYIAPRNTLEKDLANIWSSVLKIDKISIHDNFFELGGDSIKGMQFSNRMQELWQDYVYITAIFEAPTIAELSTYLCEHYRNTVTRIYGKEILEKHSQTTKKNYAIESQLPEIVNREDAQIANILSQLEEISDEEAQQLLTQQIALESTSNQVVESDDKYFMRLAIAEAKKALEENQPPYAACIVKNGEVISCVHNSIWKNQDITAHAEIQAIREACRKLQTMDLSKCVIYSTCEPCSMCLTACHWANIKTIFYGLRTEDEARMGLAKTTVPAKSMNSLGNFNLNITGDFLRDEMFEVMNIWLKQKSVTVYDQIAKNYQKTKKSLVRKYTETYTLFKMIEMVDCLKGKSVLDLGCADGYYSRIFKNHGAQKVVAIDNSAEMIKLAQEEELKEKLGIDYQVFNVIDLGKIGEFDLVIAVNVIHYARNQQELLKMCETIYQNLKPGGYLVAINENTEQNIEAYSKSQKYGISKSISLPIQEGSPITYTMFDGSEYFEIINYYYSQKVWTENLQRVGFKSIEWQSLQVDPEGIEKYGAEYWQDFLENSPNMGLICRK